MAAALIRGFLDGQRVHPDNFCVFEPAAERRDWLEQHLRNVELTDSPEDLFAKCDWVVAAVKPNVLLKELEGWATLLRDGQLFLSIAAGVGLNTLTQGLATNRVVRIMPNTPCMVGRGICAISKGDGVTSDEIQTIKQLCLSVGVAIEVPEHLMHAVTALAGSGPAFVMTILEALADGGVAVGLGRQVAQELAVQLLAGSAEMVASSNEHPAILRDRVASPAGTTIAGIEKLEANGLRHAIISAIQAANQRSKELGGD